MSNSTYTLTSYFHSCTLIPGWTPFAFAVSLTSCNTVSLQWIGNGHFGSYWHAVAANLSAAYPRYQSPISSDAKCSIYWMEIWYVENKYESLFVHKQKSQQCDWMWRTVLMYHTAIAFHFRVSNSDRSHWCHRDMHKASFYKIRWQEKTVLIVTMSVRSYWKQYGCFQNSCCSVKPWIHQTIMKSIREQNTLLNDVKVGWIGSSIALFIYSGYLSNIALKSSKRYISIDLKWHFPLDKFVN